MKIKDWSAKRAGGRITVDGIGEDGKPFKLAGVDKIVPRGGKIIAIDKNEVHHELAPA